MWNVWIKTWSQWASFGINLDKKPDKMSWMNVNYSVGCILIQYSWITATHVSQRSYLWNSPTPILSMTKPTKSLQNKRKEIQRLEKREYGWLFLFRLKYFSFMSFIGSITWVWQHMAHGLTKTRWGGDLVLFTFKVERWILFTNPCEPLKLWWNSNISNLSTLSFIHHGHIVFSIQGSKTIVVPKILNTITKTMLGECTFAACARLVQQQQSTNLVLLPQQG